MKTNTILSNIKHGIRTNINNGIVNNADAVLMLLFEMGGTAKIKNLRDSLKAWRPEGNLGFGYLFLLKPEYGTCGYGFTGTSFESVSNRIAHAGTCERKMNFSIRRTYYYRVSRGNYAITCEGFKRLSELGICAK